MRVPKPTRTRIKPMTAQKMFPSMNEPVSAIPSPWTIQMAPMIMTPTAKELGNNVRPA
jgi:hypothetical protein